MKIIKKIKLSKGHFSGEEQFYIDSAFKRGETSSFGENLIGFETDIEKYLNQNKKVVCLSSGTAAIHLSLILAGVESGDDVICQSMTFSASANPIVYLGANPVFVDSELDTWNICAVQMENAIKQGISIGKPPKAIIVVHLFGMPAKIDEIIKVAQKYKIMLIEDAAEALGSSYKGQKCGTFGDFGIFSFNGNKIISTSGGGAVICRNDQIKKRAFFLVTQAKDDTPYYQHSEIGYNYRMSNILAGIGRAQMKILDTHVQLRRNNNKFYQKLFQEVKGITVFKEPNSDFFSNHWLSCILINPKETNFNREELRLALLDENIECKPLWKPLHLQPIFKEYKHFGQKISEALFNNGLCLPSSSHLSLDEKEKIKNVITNFINDKYT